MNIQEAIITGKPVTCPTNKYTFLWYITSLGDRILIWSDHSYNLADPEWCEHFATRGRFECRTPNAAARLNDDDLLSDEWEVLE